MSQFRFPTISPELVESLRVNERLWILAGHLLVSLMITCFSITVVQVGNRLAPNWDGRYLPWVTLVVSLEAMYTKRATRKLAVLSREWVLYRGAEMVVLLIGVKILLYAIREPGKLLYDLARWPDDFFSTFFSGEYLIAALFVFVIWAFSSSFAEDLAELEGDELLLEDELPVAITTDRVLARQQLVDRVILTGALMVILAAAVRIDLLSEWGFRPPIRGSVLNVVAYFMLALALLSQTQFGILRARWTVERTPFNRNMGVRWLVYSLLFLLFLTALAWILPTRYTLGFLSVLQYVIGLFLYALVSIWGFGMLFLATLLSLLGFRNVDPQNAENPPVIPQLPPVSPAEAAPIPWLDALKSIVFWIIFLGVIGFSIHQYLSQNQELLGKLRGLPGLAWLARAWRWLRIWLLGVNHTVSTAVSAGIRRLRRPERPRSPGGGWGYVNLKRLTPRQRVIFFYLALVRRGGERGLARRSEQTPYEYQETLRAELEGVE
ncbi:MAG TPA: hypothetical protein VGA03_12625, partial [Anaerolineales bacterium]